MKKSEMLSSLIDASFVNKTELTEEFEFTSRTTLYTRLEDPTRFTLAEVETLSKFIKVPVKDICEIIYGNEDTYKRHINRLQKQLK